MAQISIINPDPTMGAAGFTFNTAAGVRVQRFDPGFPDIRQVEDLRPHQHGAANYSRYFGPREVSIEFVLAPGPLNVGFPIRVVEDILRSLCNPALRPYVVEQLEPSLPARRINVVAGELDMPYTSYNHKVGRISFRAPDGYWESDTLKQYEINSSEEAPNVAGRTYNLTFPRTYPAGQAPVGGTILLNQGTLETYPVVRLYGPFTDAVIRNSTLDKMIKLEAVALAAGNFVEIDFRNRTVLLNGDINGSYYQYVNWLQSEWWELQMGQNLITFVPTGYTSATKAIIYFRDNFL